jgi:tight adherence protein B
MVLLYGVIIFCFIAGVVLLTRGVKETRQDETETVVARLTRVRQRREELAPDYDELDDEAREAERELARREEQAAASQRPGLVPSLNKVVSSFSAASRLEENLGHLRSQWRASELVAGSIMLGILLFIVLSFLGSMIFGIVLAVLCLLLPWGYARWLRTRYLRKFEDQLSDTLLLMSNSLKAGFSFLQAMEMVSREAQPPISDEFRRVTQEIAVGLSIPQALTNLSERIKSTDLDLMVTAVLIQREVGGGLAEILEIISAVIRERMRIKGEIRVLTTQGRMTGFLLSLLPIFMGFLLHFVSIATNITGESFMNPLLHTQLGGMLIMIAIAMQLLGLFFIMRIVSIRV